MKRAALVAALVATAAAALSACGGSGGPADASSTTRASASTAAPDAAQTAGATATATPASPTTPAWSALPPSPKFYDATQTTSDGYKQTMHLTLYPAIPGRDLDVLKAAWAAVGGKGDIPCLDASGISGSTTVTIPTQSSVYAIGRLSVVNDTPDFGDGGMMWDFVAPGLSYGAAMGFEYSDKTECDGLDSGTLTKPHWTGTIWGSLPVVVAYGDVVNPKHPAGDYDKIAKAPLRLLETGNVQKVTITSGTTRLPDGIELVPIDPAWLSDAKTHIQR
ncbi:hypothetical protein [Streptomyces sp. HPF1205]|uniref:hypothetical protein n=1 Tax=Streptomyces sp. HPF1205 TaxID=2873262 RepID=UPI001CEC2BD6|nr:hypothetical protein [Streptomyces sp. HPF1205]